ncbi:Cyclic nucleotide-gated cation channel alpha-3 [Aphelenchoides fujianensis]|nr:Cyclic nucleotide-gated cation channel alpha-3 [Aphelenchoides fujianensis]
MVVFNNRNGEIPTVVEPPAAAADTPRVERLWKRGAVLGILRSILPTGSTPPNAIQRQLSDIDTGGQRPGPVDFEDETKWEVALDATSRVVDVWNFVVSLASVYNLIAIPLPAFDDIVALHYGKWLLLNLVADFVFVSDLFFQCFVSYYSAGILVRNVRVIAGKYAKRVNRLAKCYRIFFYLSRLQMRTKWSNVVVLSRVIVPIVFIFHWNACGYFALSLHYGIEDSDRTNWAFSYSKIMDPLFSNCNWLPWNRDCEFDETPLNGTKDDYVELMNDYWIDKLVVLNFTNLSKKYVLSFYWSSMTITTLGEQPEPDFSAQNVYEILNTVVGIMIFGTIMGSVAEIVRNANSYSREIRFELDMAKIFIRNRAVELEVQNRVFNYFDYATSERRFFDDPTRSDSLTRPLQSAIRNQILLDKFRSLDLFCGVGTTFLEELIAFSEVRLFGPSDFLCYKGDVVREMYVVETGMLLEIEKKTVGRRLTAGCSFGELSMIFVPEHKHANRHSTSVVSVGFSEVYVLSVERFRALLKDFPEVAMQLEKYTRTRLAAAGLLRDADEMRSARRHERPTVDLEDRLQELRHSVRNLSVVLTAQSGRFKKRRKSLNKRLARLETCVRGIDAERAAFKPSTSAQIDH